MSLTGHHPRSGTMTTIALVMNCRAKDGTTLTEVQQQSGWYHQLDTAVQTSNPTTPITILTIPAWINQNSQPERNVIAFDGSRRLAFVAIESHETREHVLSRLSCSAARNASFNVVFLTRLDDQPAWNDMLACSAAIVRAYGPDGYSRAQVGNAVYDLPRTNTRDVNRLCLWRETSDIPTSRVLLSVGHHGSDNDDLVTSISPAGHHESIVNMEPGYGNPASIAITQQMPENIKKATSVSPPGHRHSQVKSERSVYISTALERAIQIAALRAQVVVLTECKAQLETREREERQRNSDTEWLRTEIDSLYGQILHHSNQIENLEREG